MHGQAYVGHRIGYVYRVSGPRGPGYYAAAAGGVLQGGAAGGGTGGGRTDQQIFRTLQSRVFEPITERFIAHHLAPLVVPAPDGFLPLRQQNRHRKPATLVVGDPCEYRVPPPVESFKKFDWEWWAVDFWKPGTVWAVGEAAPAAGPAVGPAAEPPPPTWALDAGRRPVPGKRGDGHIAVLPVDAGVAASDVRTPDDERLMRCVPRDCRGRAAAPSLDQDRVAKSKLVALLAEAQRHLNLRVARVKAKAVERRACRQCAAVTTLTHHVAGGFTATHCRDCARASSGGTLVDARQRVVLTYNAPDVTGGRPTWTCPTLR